MADRAHKQGSDLRRKMKRASTRMPSASASAVNAHEPTAVFVWGSKKRHGAH